MNSLVHNHPNLVLDQQPEPHSTSSGPLLSQSSPHEGLTGAPSAQGRQSTTQYSDGIVYANTGSLATDGTHNDSRAQEKGEEDSMMVAGTATSPPGPSIALPPLYTARLPLHHHTLYQMMMAASVLRLPGVMARALMGSSLSTPTHPTDLTKEVTLPTSLARLYQNGQRLYNSSDAAPTDCSRAAIRAREAEEKFRRGTEGHKPLECNPVSAKVNTEHELASGFGVDTSEHPQINVVSDRPQTPLSKLNEKTMLSKSGRSITPSKILLASADSFPSTSTASARSPAMDCTASSMIKSHCFNRLRGRNTAQEVPTTAAVDESRDALLVKHQVFRPTPTRAAVSQQEQHLIANLAQQQQQRRHLVLSVPAVARGGVHRPHPYLRGSVAPPVVHPVVLQHDASYRDVYRNSAIAQEGMLLAAAADRARRALRQVPAEGQGLLCTPREGEGDEERHQDVGGDKKSSGECRQAGALLDIAACDGPVFFERVLNKAFAGNCLEDIDSDMEINVDELDSADDSSLHTTTSAATSSQQHGGLPGTALNTSDERMETSTVAVKQAGGSQPRLLHTLSSTYHCVYCNHTFKSHYCYQKHMRRHINPITVEVGPRALTPLLGTPNKKSKEQKGERELEPTPKDLHGVCTDHPTTSLRNDCSSNSGIHNIDQLATDSGNEDKQGIFQPAVPSRALLPDTNIPTALLLVPSIKSDCRQKNLQQPTVPLATASLTGSSPLSPRLPSPLPVKASLDLNVQYFPCKTCGSKFPSYYFVHKHRRMCHGEENAGVSGGGLDTHSSSNSNHSDGNSNHSGANNNYGCSNSNQGGGISYQSGGNSSHEGGNCLSEDNSNSKVADNNHVADDVNLSDGISIHSTPTTAQASDREGQISKKYETSLTCTGPNEAKAIIPIGIRTVSVPHDEQASEMCWQTSLVHAAECAEDDNDESRSDTEEEKTVIQERHGDCSQRSAKGIRTETCAEGVSDKLMEACRHHGQGGTIGGTTTDDGPEDAPINYSSTS